MEVLAAPKHSVRNVYIIHTPTSSEHVSSFPSPFTLHPPQKARSPCATAGCILILVSSTSHLPVPAPLFRCIICVQDPRLTFIRLTERIPSLFPHTLHLSHFPDSLLELFHPRSVILDVIFLNLLDMMVRLWFIHSLPVFPCHIPKQACHW